MPFTKLSQEQIDKIRSLRAEGNPIESISQKLGLSSGVCSKYSREISLPAKIKKENPIEIKPSASHLAVEAKIDRDDLDDGNVTLETKEQIQQKMEIKAETNVIEAETKRMEAEIKNRQMREQHARGVLKDGQSNTQPKYVVIAGKPVRDDTNSDGMTFTQCLQLIEVQNRQQQPSNESQAMTLSLLKQQLEQKDDKEPHIIKDENGVPQLNLNAKSVTAAEAMLVQATQPKPDSIQQIMQAEEAKKQLKDSLGIKADGGDGSSSKEIISLMMQNSQLQMEKMTTVMTSTVTEAIKAMTEAVKANNANKEESPELKAIREQNKLLAEKLDQEQEARHQAELAQRDRETAQRDKETSELKNQVQALATKTGGQTTELDIIKEGVKEISSTLKSAGSDVIGLLKNPPAPLTQGEKDAVKAGLKHNLEKSTIPEEARRLAEKNGLI